jgi:hypothetical protein
MVKVTTAGILFWAALAAPIMMAQVLRAELVLNDRNGELIAPVVQNGRPDRGMPAMALSMPQIADVAAFVHSSAWAATMFRGCVRPA